MSTHTPATWGTRLGFILASAGSAVGLGAIWKFPYMAGTNGGSVFMLPYIFFTVTIGLTLLIGEMCMGRSVRAGAAGAFAAGADVVSAVTDITLNPDPEARVRAWIAATR